MARNREHERQPSLHEAWDAAVRGEDSAALGASPERAELLRLIQARGELRTPAAARARARRRIDQAIANQPRRLTNMDTVLPIAPPSALPIPNGHRPLPLFGPRRTAARRVQRGLSAAGALLLVIALLGSFFALYRSGDHAAITTGLASPVATPATPAPPSVFLPPHATVDGLGLADWQERWYQWYASLATQATDPINDPTGARCAFGQHGPVFFLTITAADAERTCSTPAGVVLFVPIMVSDCSTLEPPPFSATDEASLRICAKDKIDPGVPLVFSKMSLIVDGQAVDLTDYRTSTPLFTMVWPPDNDAGATPGVAQAVGDGYTVMLAPLTPGEHTVEMAVPVGGPNVRTLTYHLTVATGEIAPDSTSAPAS